MSTTPNQPQPPVVPSSAIHKGADLLIAFIEKEKEEAVADARRDHQDLERRFEEFRATTVLAQASAAQRGIDAELSLNLIQKKLTEQCEDTLKAREETKGTWKEAEEARQELQNLRSVLGSYGIFYTGEGALEFNGAWTEVTAEISAQPHTEDSEGPSLTSHFHPDLLLQMLRNRSKENLRVMEELRAQISAIEDERDNTKRAMESEVGILKDRILLLEAEAKMAEAVRSRPREDVSVQTAPNLKDAEIQTPFAELAPNASSSSVKSVQTSPVISWSSHVVNSAAGDSRCISSAIITGRSDSPISKSKSPELSKVSDASKHKQMDLARANSSIVSSDGSSSLLVTPRTGSHKRRIPRTLSPMLERKSTRVKKRRTGEDAATPTILTSLPPKITTTTTTPPLRSLDDSESSLTFPSSDRVTSPVHLTTPAKGQVKLAPSMQQPSASSPPKRQSNDIVPTPQTSSSRQKQPVVTPSPVSTARTSQPSRAEPREINVFLKNGSAAKVPVLIEHAKADGEKLTSKRPASSTLDASAQPQAKRIKRKSLVIGQREGSGTTSVPYVRLPDPTGPLRSEPGPSSQEDSYPRDRVLNKEVSRDACNILHTLDLDHITKSDALAAHTKVKERSAVAAPIQPSPPKKTTSLPPSSEPPPSTSLAHPVTTTSPETRLAVRKMKMSIKPRKASNASKDNRTISRAATVFSSKLAVPITSAKDHGESSKH